MVYDQIFSCFLEPFHTYLTASPLPQRSHVPLQYYLWLRGWEEMEVEFWGRICLTTCFLSCSLQHRLKMGARQPCPRRWGLVMSWWISMALHCMAPAKRPSSSSKAPSGSSSWLSGGKVQGHFLQGVRAAKPTWFVIKPQYSHISINITKERGVSHEWNSVHNRKYCIRRKAFGSNPDTVTNYLCLLYKFTLPLQESVLFAIERKKMTQCTPRASLTHRFFLSSS